jgi:hypothetical protein
MRDEILRQHLVELLRGGSAHVPLRQALGGLPASLRTVAPSGMAHSVWQLLEHMRLAQEDILRFTLDPSWESPPWPDGYWPAEVPATLTDGAWDASLEGFLGGLDEVMAMVENIELDLGATIPHGDGQTYLREALLVADHNAYHIAQVVDVRRALGAWPPRE